MNNTIKLNIKADNKILPSKEQILETKSTNTFLEENDFATVISTLNTLITDINAIKKIYQFSFYLELLDIKKQVINSFDNEFSFFEAAVKHDNLSSKIMEYTKVTAKGKYDSRIWLDDETPAGTGAIMALVTKNIKWIPSYIDFLRSSDLDHEVNQSGDIFSIIKKYGWCEETLTIVIARLLSCHGQHGEEDFEAFLEDGLLNFIKENESLFIEKLKEELENPIFKSELTYSKEEYIEEIFEYYIEILVENFDNDFIEDVKKGLSDVWTKFNKKQ